MKPTTVKKVLIALDYNPTAQKVAETGYEFAKMLNAEITLLHIISEDTDFAALGYSPIMGYAGYADSDISHNFDNEGLKKAALHFLEKTKTHLEDSSIQILVKEGEYADTILKTAKIMHIDTIVIGTHSRKWLENTIMGSVTEEVLRHSTIPLFIIPTKRNNS
jgi:nucleotide-binding universal stress UspA family protein